MKKRISRYLLGHPIALRAGEVKRYYIVFILYLKFIFYDVNFKTSPINLFNCFVINTLKMLAFYLFTPYVYIKYLCYNLFLLTQTLFPLDMENTLFSFFFQCPFTHLKRTCDDPPHSLFSCTLFLLSACHFSFCTCLCTEMCRPLHAAITSNGEKHNLYSIACLQNF